MFHFHIHHFQHQEHLQKYFHIILPLHFHQKKSSSGSNTFKENNYNINLSNLNSQQFTQNEINQIQHQTQFNNIEQIQNQSRRGSKNIQQQSQTQTQTQTQTMQMNSQNIANVEDVIDPANTEEAKRIRSEREAKHN